MGYILYFITVLFLAWAGLHNILVGLAYWEYSRGAFLPIAVGLLFLAIFVRVCVKMLRKYYSQSEKERKSGDLWF